MLPPLLLFLSLPRVGNFVFGNATQKGRGRRRRKMWHPDRGYCSLRHKNASFLFLWVKPFLSKFVTIRGKGALKAEMLFKLKNHFPLP